MVSLEGVAAQAETELQSVPPDGEPPVGAEEVIRLRFREFRGNPTRAYTGR